VQRPYEVRFVWRGVRHFCVSPRTEIVPQHLRENVCTVRCADYRERIAVAVNLSSHCLSRRVENRRQLKTTCRRHELSAQVLAVTSGNFSGFIRSRKIPMHCVAVGRDLTAAVDVPTRHPVRETT